MSLGNAKEKVNGYFYPPCQINFASAFDYSKVCMLLLDENSNKH